MALVNPFYVRSSSVGDVVDVATWSPRKALGTAIFGIVLGIGFAAAACFLWDAKLFVDAEPDWLARTNKEHGPRMQAAVGVLGFLAVAVVIGALSALAAYTKSDYYLRAGPGGLSVRVPDCIPLGSLVKSSDALEFDIPWTHVRRWGITEERPVGGLSTSTYEYPPIIDLETVDGEKYCIPTDYFRESTKIIATKIQDAMEMTVPDLFGKSCDIS